MITNSVSTAFPICETTSSRIHVPFPESGSLEASTSLNSHVTAGDDVTSTRRISTQAAGVIPSEGLDDQASGIFPPARMFDQEAVVLPPQEAAVPPPTRLGAQVAGSASPPRLVAQTEAGFGTSLFGADGAGSADILPGVNNQETARASTRVATPSPIVHTAVRGGLTRRTLNVQAPGEASSGTEDEKESNDPDWNPILSSSQNTATASAVQSLSIAQAPNSAPVVPNSLGSSAGRTSPSKRLYNFVNRLPSSKPRVQSVRPYIWLKKIESMTEPQLRRTRCCRSLRCFHTVVFEYYIERAKEIVPASPAARRAILNGFRGMNDKYYFNGRPVCVRFLKMGFHFSSFVLSSHRRACLERNSGSTIYSAASLQTPSTSSTRSDVCNEDSSSSSQLQSADSTNSLSSSSKQKTAIISFLMRLSEDCSDRMPNRPEVHLPFFRRCDVYELFTKEHSSLYPGRTVPSVPYFMRIWRQCTDHIKVRHNHGFTVFNECEQLRRALNDAVVKSLPTSQIMAQKSKHNEYVRAERLSYALRRDRARLNPSEKLSIIVDGADQSAFGLPHFVSSVKSVRGHSLKVKLVGLLHHQTPNNLHLFTMTEEHETGSNHIVETIHRFINTQQALASLPREFYVQLDNCSRENKNHYLMAYLESLVAWDVFDVVEASFLPVGHTHEDIDQIFSVTSSRLRVNDAVTLSDLHFQLSQTLGGRTRVTEMKRVLNWSGLCSQENCIKKLTNITQFRFFKFSRAKEGSAASQGSVPFKTCGHTKRTCSDEWTPMASSPKSLVQGVLPFCPQLRNTPSITIKCPDG